MEEKHVEKEEEGVKKEDMTCFYCQEAGSCPYAWDDYNIDNECLAGK